MMFPTYSDIKGYDQAHGTDWIGSVRSVCERHSVSGQDVGAFSQFRTDWISGGLRHAVLQTLRYVGFGYEDAMVFKDVGDVVGRMFEAIESGR